MLVSIDGRIVTRDWPLSPEGRGQYESVHASYEADGWICGRVTMEPFAKQMRSEAEVAREHAGAAAREDFRAPGDHGSFAFAIDPSGRLAWEANDIDGDHVVTILSERVSDEYLAFLRARWTLMLEGGGRINGGMLSGGLIDEVSLLVAPVADGRMGTPALFDVDDDTTPRRLALVAVERRAGDVLWLRYRVESE